MPRRWLPLLPIAVFTLGAQSASLWLTHPYGELVDSGPTTAHFEASYPDRIDCRIAPEVRVAGNEVTITARRMPPGGPPVACLLPPQAALGELSAGAWRVVLRVIDAVGPSLIERHESEWRVHRPNTTCHRFPEWRSSVIVTHKTLGGRQLRDRIAVDPSFAAMLGDPLDVYVFTSWPEDAILYYRELDNPHDVRARLEATGEFARLYPSSTPVCIPEPTPDELGTAVEFHHAGLDHYFYAVSAQEIASLEGGTGVRGWARTGKTFEVLVRPGCPADRHDQAAYRFFGKPGVGPSSHVFTVDREECRIVDRSGAWLFEGSPFWATPPDSTGGCAEAGEIPLYRVWKAFGDSNHRFTTERSVVDEMRARGWFDEGVAMCVRRPRPPQ